MHTALYRCTFKKKAARSVECELAARRRVRRRGDLLEAWRGLIGLSVGDGLVRLWTMTRIARRRVTAVQPVT